MFKIFKSLEARKTAFQRRDFEKDEGGWVADEDLRLILFFLVTE